ncbi:DUF1998 domain-containing protein [Planococcus wigleyi]|uniref:DUF1998 domain-containing protein n=1 Tax=Planococcus wigleyi TaxID=2762216 RepID=A0ABR8WBU1_9BACL|nr:DUF1998 domain-containing protein [Planococcus wigleyi]MBD8014492.1 DUF1998 domain-containing protein [Planococcus wigleyi]
MRILPLRRSQLVGSNGPGSLVVSPEGETAIVGALDYWFQNSSGKEVTSRAEFEIHEPRLKGFLGVNKLYSPPDFRDVSSDIANSKLYIPLLRFPKWHYCSFCSMMREFNYTIENTRSYCNECNKQQYFKQVPFIVICSNGHISDFPWHEWVHENEGSTCRGRLKLITMGGATLDSWVVKCSCNSKRSLKGITSNASEKRGSSVLGERLNSHSSEYKCRGHKAWCGDEYEECHESPVAILRNSINVYMPQKVSVISIPGEKNMEVDRILNTLEKNIVIKGLLSTTENIDEKIEILLNSLGTLINAEREDYEKAILYLDGSIVENGNTIQTGSPALLRSKEFEKLQQNCSEPYLKVLEEWIKDEDADSQSNIYAPYFEKINRVTKLRETTALSGFKRLSRTDEEGQYSYSASYDSLYHKKLPNNQKWLPASTVYGEGIFIKFDLKEIEEWEKRGEVRDYFKQYMKRISGMNHSIPEIISNPRNIMLHTLSHLLIEEIANTSGYNMASIRERMYLQTNQASLLIYTSAGDMDGTFGGLVRMGKKSSFFELVDKAVANARWCSSDPVCSELGFLQGQGLNGVNGAACYNCSHLPETSCEIGNMYLDRTFLIDSKIGFFNNVF